MKLYLDLLTTSVKCWLSLHFGLFHGRYYLYCDSSGIIKTPTDDLSGSDFTSFQTDIAGNPVITRHNSYISITMNTGDGITDLGVRRG